MASRKVTLPDGRVVKNVPDDVPDEAVIQQYTATPAAAPAAPASLPLGDYIDERGIPHIQIGGNRPPTDELAMAPRVTPTRTPLETLGRTAGLTARAGSRALTGAAEFVGDLGVAPFNMLGMASNKFLGTNVPHFTTGTEAGDMARDTIFPTPETEVEKGVDLAGGALSSIPSIGTTALKTGVKALEPMAKEYGQQAAGALGAVGGSLTAQKYAPDSVIAQILAPLFGGLVGAKGGATLGLDNDLSTAPRLRLKQFNDANVKPSWADVSQNPAVQTQQAAQQTTPWAAGKVQREETGRIQQAQDEATRIATGYGMPRSMEEAGNILKTSVKRFIDKVPVFGAINKALKPDEFYAAQDKAIKRLQEEADVAYAEARRETPYYYSGDLAEFLQRPMMNSALGIAKVNAADQGRQFGIVRLPSGRMAKGKLLGPQGDIEALTFDAVDDIKQALDKIIQQAKNPLTGGNKNAARIAIENKHTFLDLVGASDKSGKYAKARAQYGDNAGVVKSFDNGRDFFSMDPEIIALERSKLGSRELDAWNTGVARALSDKLTKMQDSKLAADADMFKSPQTREQIKAALGNDREFKRIMASVDRVDRAMKDVFGATSSEAAFKQIADAADAKHPNLQKLRSLVKTLNGEEMGDIASTLISRMGRPNKGVSVVPGEADFSVSTFSTNYRGMDNTAKSYLFGHNPELKAALDNLADVTAFMKRTDTFANKSRSATVGAQKGGMATLGAAGAAAWAGNPGTAAAILLVLGATLGGMRISASAMYNPAWINLMTNSIKVAKNPSPQRVMGAIVGIDNFLSKNPEYREEGEKLKAIFEQ